MSNDSPIDEYGSPPDYEALCRVTDEAERAVEASKRKEEQEKLEKVLQKENRSPESPAQRPAPRVLTENFRSPSLGERQSARNKRNEGHSSNDRKKKAVRTTSPPVSPGTLVLSQPNDNNPGRNICPYCLQDPCDNQEDIDDTKQRISMYYCSRIYDDYNDHPGNFQRRALFKDLYKDIVIAKGRDAYARKLPACVKATSLEMFPAEPNQIIDFYGNLVRNK